MKIDGLTHPKTKELAFTLDIPLPHAIGLLELLWAFVAQQTPRGNVGKWSNQVIASESGWQDDADRFIDSLVSVGFLDENDEHRLLVHDWKEHCPNWVHAKLKKKGKSILSADLRGDLRTPSTLPPEATTSLATPSQEKTPLSDKSDECREVFEHWQEVMSHPRAKLDDKRRKKVNSRLKDGYTVDDLKQAINGCKKSPHHMGENDRATVYDGLELICRDAEHVDKFIAVAEGRGLKGQSAEPRPPHLRKLN